MFKYVLHFHFYFFSFKVLPLLFLTVNAQSNLVLLRNSLKEHFIFLTVIIQNVYSILIFISDSQVFLHPPKNFKVRLQPTKFPKSIPTLNILRLLLFYCVYIIFISLRQGLLAEYRMSLKNRPTTNPPKRGPFFQLWQNIGNIEIKP